MMSYYLLARYTKTAHRERKIPVGNLSVIHPMRQHAFPCGGNPSFCASGVGRVLYPAIRCGVHGQGVSECC